MQPLVSCEVADGVATLRFERPEKLNALSPAVFARLGELLTEVAGDPAVSVVVLRGAGRAFAAGADIANYVDLSHARFREMIDHSREVTDRFAACPKPIVAVVRGFALGGGFELVMACDLVVAASNARFGLPEAGLGLLPGGGGTQRLPRLVGRMRANELIMTRRILTADEAREWGLVNRVCPESELEETLENVLGELAGSAPAARGLAKRLVAEAADVDLASGLIMERDVTSPLIESADGREGVRAFVEKRSPSFGHGERWDFDGLDRAELRARPGIKWVTADPGVTPAWVADMDFPVPAVIVDALRLVVEHGDLGYPDWDSGTPLRAAFAERMSDRYGWEPNPARVREQTHIVQAIQLLLHLATSEGDAVAVQTPCYPPFLASFASMRRRTVPVPMIDTADGWRIDMPALAEAAAGGCKVFVLVNPHNPTGRVLTREELGEIAAIARRHDMLVVSDEVHAEQVYSPHEHVPFASLSADAAARTVTMTSAAKAFNVAALRCCVLHYGPDRLLAVRDAQPSELFGAVSTLGVAGTLAAWRDGGPWQKDMLAVLERNRRRVAAFVTSRLPGVRHHMPEGTYLSWLDTTALDLGMPAKEHVLRVGRVELEGGEKFGPGGDAFIRLNFATSQAILGDILDGVGRALGPP